jgi:hypothetical protein
MGLIVQVSVSIGNFECDTRVMLATNSFCLSVILRSSFKSSSLGVITAFLGRNIDKNGQDMLRQSLQLLDHVQQRVQLELCHHQEQHEQQQQFNTTAVATTTPAISKHWSTLQLSIWNNQACVLSELAVGIMRDHERLDRLIQMGLTLSKVSAVLDVSDQDRFHWTVQVLMEDNFAPAA